MFSRCGLFKDSQSGFGADSVAWAADREKHMNLPFGGGPNIGDTCFEG